MRVAALLFIGFVGVMAYPEPSHAVSVSTSRIEAAPSPNIVEVDRRCGPGRHWIHRHRNRAGHWVRGHCSRRH
jgi:hypothetical protein